VTQIFSDGTHYNCAECGHRWKSSSRYQWWPLRLKWNWDASPRHFFAHHGWQTGWDGVEQRVFGQTFHIGPLKICLGADLLRDDSVRCGACDRERKKGKR
jgi:hypothetical protein